MDGRRFDALSRALAATPSRRQLVRGAVTGLGAFLIAGRGQDTLAATCGTFCKALTPGRERGACTETCAHNSGLIAACDGDATRLRQDEETGSLVCGCRSSGDCGGDGYCAVEECGAVGACTPMPDCDSCPQIFDPVCACDGRSYPNSCLAACAGQSVLSDGECPSAS